MYDCTPVFTFNQYPIKKKNENYTFCIVFTRLHTFFVKSAIIGWMFDVFVKDSHRLNMAQWQTIQ